MTSKPDLDPVFAARIGDPVDMRHFLHAPRQIVHEVEIRLGVGRKYQIVLRHRFQSCHERTSGIECVRRADHLAVGENHVLAGVFAANVLTQALVRLAIQGGFSRNGCPVHDWPPDLGNQSS